MRYPKLPCPKATSLRDTVSLGLRLPRARALLAGEAPGPRAGIRGRVGTEQTCEPRRLILISLYFTPKRRERRNRF